MVQTNKIRIAFAYRPVLLGLNDHHLQIELNKITSVAVNPVEESDVEGWLDEALRCVVLHVDWKIRVSAEGFVLGV